MRLLVGESTEFACCNVHVNTILSYISTVQLRQLHAILQPYGERYAYSRMRGFFLLLQTISSGSCFVSFSSAVEWLANFCVIVSSVDHSVQNNTDRFHGYLVFFSSATCLQCPTHDTRSWRFFIFFFFIFFLFFFSDTV